MLIQVNPIVGVWGFHSQEDTKYLLWFTVADPQPQKITMEELPDDMRNAVLGALRTKKLIEVGETAEEATSTKVYEPVAEELGVNPAFEERAKGLLDAGVNSIRREVALIKDAILLSTCISVEKRGSNRKTVIELLQKQLSKASGPSNTVKDRLKRVTRGPRSMYDDLIEEEEGEEVTFYSTALSSSSETEKSEHRSKKEEAGLVDGSSDDSGDKSS